MIRLDIPLAILFFICTYFYWLYFFSINIIVKSSFNQNAYALRHILKILRYATLTNNVYSLKKKNPS